LNPAWPGEVGRVGGPLNAQFSRGWRGCKAGRVSLLRPRAASSKS
jgi:hypothetical protein